MLDPGLVRRDNPGDGQRARVLAAVSAAGFLQSDGFRGSGRAFHAGEMARCKAPCLIMLGQRIDSRILPQVGVSHYSVRGLAVRSAAKRRRRRAPRPVAQPIYAERTSARRTR